MKTVVFYASRYGSTKAIAEFIAEKLCLQGILAEARSTGMDSNPEDYDAIVIGSAVYMQHWMDEAVEFVQKHRAVLMNRPVWLFSSGPLELSPEIVLENNLRLEPKDIPELQGAINPRDHRIFFGILDPMKLGFKHRVLRKLPAAHAILPEGDFRNWNEIEAWANGIARALESLHVASESGREA
ncbi:MAG: protoporphyrinogen oxidase [Methanomassiliicoccus sp.]|nr:MAG: protoporphyrinogen oxidase [Methanomassiliicoccus sp.]